MYLKPIFTRLDYTALASKTQLDVNITLLLYSILNIIYKQGDSLRTDINHVILHDMYVCTSCYSRTTRLFSHKHTAIGVNIINFNIMHAEGYSPSIFFNTAR